MLYPKLDLKLEASSLAMSANERVSANKPATAIPTCRSTLKSRLLEPSS